MTSNTPSNPPSSRPMTLRQQLYGFFLDGIKEIPTNPTARTDAVLRILDPFCQEIAREARPFNPPLDGIQIEVNIVGPDKHRRYSTTPIDDRPELVAYYLDKFAKQYSRELTQKPPQTRADMQSDTSPKADNNQVDN